MKKIELFEKAIRDQAPSLKERNINATMFWAYRYSVTAECKNLNFYEVIWEDDIQYILETCKAEGIKKFTISSTFSSLLKTLAEFEKAGCKIGKLTQVPSYWTIYKSGEETRELLPAITINIA